MKVGVGTFTHALKLVDECAEYVGFINSDNIGDSDETAVRMQSLVDDLIERQR
jgi:endo-beta-N-acetylglucosaminidase D